MHTDVYNYEKSLQNVPIIGSWLKRAAFSRIATVYDMLVNYIESHTKAQKMLKSVINDKDFVQKILNEGQHMINHA